MTKELLLTCLTDVRDSEREQVEVLLRLFDSSLEGVRPLLVELHALENEGLRGPQRAVPVRTLCRSAGVSETSARRLLFPTKSDSSKKSDEMISYAAFGLAFSTRCFKGKVKASSFHARCVELKKVLIAEASDLFSRYENPWKLVAYHAEQGSSFLVMQWLKYVAKRSEGLPALDVFEAVRKTQHSIHLIRPNSNETIERHFLGFSCGHLMAKTAWDVRDEILSVWPD